MARHEDRADRPVAEGIEVVGAFAAEELPFDARVVDVGADIGGLREPVRLLRVFVFGTLDDLGRPGKAADRPAVVEVEMRLQHVADVAGLDAPGFCNEIVGFWPIAPCGRSSLLYSAPSLQLSRTSARVRNQWAFMHSAQTRLLEASAKALSVGLSWPCEARLRCCLFATWLALADGELLCKIHYLLDYKQ